MAATACISHINPLAVSAAGGFCFGLQVVREPAFPRHDPTFSLSALPLAVQSLHFFSHRSYRRFLGFFSFFRQSRSVSSQLDALPALLGLGMSCWGRALCLRTYKVNHRSTILEHLQLGKIHLLNAMAYARHDHVHYDDSRDDPWIGLVGQHNWFLP